MKTKLIALTMLVYQTGTAQIYTPSGTITGTSSSPTSVGIGTPIINPNLILDVRGNSSFGGGLSKTDFNWAMLPNERTLILTGNKGGYGTMVIGNNDFPSTGQPLGFLGFVQRTGTTGVTNSGFKVAINGESAGTGGSTSGFGGSLVFRTTGDNTGVILPERMRLDYNGNLGIGVTSPTEQLHTSLGVRFSGLTIGGIATNMIVSDITGKLWLKSLPSAGITNSCTTLNYVPKTSSLGGNLTCSQIFDNGTSVGIGTTIGFGYTWPGGLTGSTLPPSVGNVKLNINGVSKALAYFATSDIRYKKEILSIENASDIINKLEGKSYFWKADEYKDKGFSNVKQFGFIAQELEKIIPEVVATDEAGFKSVNYDMLIPILVQNTKELNKKIEHQQKQIDEHLKVINILINENKNTTELNENQIRNNDISMFQNIPNPFSDYTIINYSIPSYIKNATLNIYDLTGKQIKAYNITARGESSISVTSDNLVAGIYIYNIITDGKLVDSKRMIISEK